MQGYYRFPDVYKDTVIFVSESDIWSVSSKNGIARRLTNSFGEIIHPKISPDGKWVAYASNQEGDFEIYVTSLSGGESRRLTFLGSRSVVSGWSADSTSIIFNSSFASAFESFAYEVLATGGEPKLLPYGPCTKIAFGEKGSVVLGRHVGDPARWKRYKGGTAGELWSRKSKLHKFERILKDLKGNIACPLIIGSAVYFISDHDGIGNLYSCDFNGKKIKKLTDHDEYYVRNATSDGRSIVYHAGADLFQFDIKSNTSHLVSMKFKSTVEKRARKFISARFSLQDFDLHPGGTHLVFGARGRLFNMPNWNGPVQQHGAFDGVRYRLPVWLEDGDRFVAVSDEVLGEDRLVIFDMKKKDGKLLERLKVGRVHDLVANPEKKQVALTNHMNEILLVDLSRKSKKVIDRSSFSRIGKPSFSPNGFWLVYSFQNSETTSIIKLADLKSGKTYEITEPVFEDDSPVFSEDGKYIFFIGNRDFTPSYDVVHFDLGFQKASKVYAIGLTKDVTSPFDLEPQSPSGTDKDDDKKKNVKKNKQIKIDIAGIKKRLIEFPISSGNYDTLTTAGKRIFFLSKPLLDDDEDEKGGDLDLRSFDLEKCSGETLAYCINDYQLSLYGDDMVLLIGNDLRVVKSGDKINEDDEGPANLKTGWVNLSRASLSIDRQKEWNQMYREAWLLQREHFWTKNMSGVDWDRIYKRYQKLLPRISTRYELSDLMWEMQGELGTSHCYEFGGDYEDIDFYRPGKLGCTFKPAGNHYAIDKIFFGDATNKTEYSPLQPMGYVVKEGDLLLAVNDIKVDKNISPRELLLNTARNEISLSLRSKSNKKVRQIKVKPLPNDKGLLYRDWVEKNREFVHKKSGNKIGYVHIPDMGPKGYSEFHRYFLAECRFENLIVDVRYNGGGHVSQLILEKLNRKVLGYDVQRWSDTPEPYPLYAIPGYINCLTNEFAGSDGDIFSHSFKMMKIGKLIGKRTWGGVIGINSQYQLIDGTITTQPEYSFWFKDVGWGVENYGTDPDIEVECSPEDFVKGKDTQLDFILQYTLDQMRKNPIEKPKWGKRPSLSLPVNPKPRK